VQDSFAEHTFEKAYDLWISEHIPFISPRTLRDYKQYANPLLIFFGKLQLRHIGIGTVRGYQAWRWKRAEPITGEMGSKYTHAAETVRIKNEINCILKPILREAGKWEELEKKKFKHLPVPREGSGTPLTTPEQSLVLEVAFSKKKWLLTAHCQRIMYRTGTLFGELRKVRRKHVDLKHGTVTITEGAKNSGPRLRTVTLVPSALESMQWILDRWQEKGGTSPEQYILPHRIKGFETPMTSTYRSWVAIVDATIAKHPSNAELINKLEQTRQCDGRTSAACLLLKNPKLSLPTIEKALGWTPSSAMRKRYNRVELDDQREALNTLEAS